MLFSDLSSFLNAGVTSAYFKPLGYCELDNALLKLLYTKYKMKSLFSFTILTVISSVWEVVLILNLLTSFIVFPIKQIRKQNHTFYSLHVFINKEETGMISDIYCCRNCILRASIPWFCGEFRSRKLRVTLMN